MIDDDDAPELTAQWFAKATPMIGNHVVRKAEKMPENDCPVCGAKAGTWCHILAGGSGWQHDDRPASSWEKA